MDNQVLELTFARRVPAEIRKMIIDKKYIETANELSDFPGTPMEFLFDVYEEFLDPSKNIGPFSCPKCRHEVLNVFRRLRPLFLKLNTE